MVRGLMVYRCTKFERNLRGRDFDLVTLLDLWRSNGLMPGKKLLRVGYGDHILSLHEVLAKSEGSRF